MSIESRWQPWALWLGWAVVLAVAFYLRFWELGMQIVIDDEWHAINQLKSSTYWLIASTFGTADHSIPLTLYDKLLADTVGLNEWGLRLPMAIAGLVAVAAVPWLFRRRLDALERLATGALIAISPVLIQYARQGRPYAITILLAVIALVAFYRWWRGRGRGHAAVYVVCTALAAWLHLVSLAFTFAAPLWAGIRALQAAWREGTLAPLWPLAKLGAVTFAACGVLLLPPLLNDFVSLAAKAGEAAVRPRTLVVAWGLFVGTGHAWVAVAFGALTVYGGAVFYRRDRVFGAYLAFVIAVALLLITLSGASWIKHGAVFIRYAAPAVPILLMGAAVGLVHPARRWLSRTPALAAGLASIVVACGVLFLTGPLPRIYQGINQFTNHASYQFDYDWQRNKVRRYLAGVEPLPIYRRIRDMTLGPGWDIVETPWRLESSYNPLYIYQRVHQLPVRIGFMSGLCAEPFYGEYGIDKEGLEFEYFVHLKELLNHPGTKRFVIFHLEPFRPDIREIPSVKPCLRAFKRRFGEPWYRSDRVAVFRFNAEGEPVRG